MEKQLYFNKLDSLRFIAFFLVIWQHAFSNSFKNISENYIIATIIQKITVTGEIGVHIFFVISGFLITYLMLQEEKSKGRFNIGYFYLRRFFRIWPLYYLIMILGVFVLPNLYNTLSFNGDVIKNLFFLNNFDMVNTNSNVGIAWSVAIEEQFYLFWPLFFLLFKNKNLLCSLSITLFMLSTLFVLKNPSEAYFHTFGNIRFLMMGCVGAILYSKYEEKARKLPILRPQMIYYAIVAILFFVICSSFSKTINFLSLIGLPILYLFLVVNLVIQGNDQKKRVLSKLGKYTYGMYLYHPLIIIFVKIIFDLLSLSYKGNPYINFGQALLSLIITIIVSYFSYEYFEKKILKYKNRFSFLKTRI
jgi:peptidoglycan/LPS O-acetylase OafA/YrhL